LEDSTSATIETIFEETANIIHTVRQTPGGKVLVHCHAGVSRSATIILVYLMRYCNLRLAQAFDLTFRARPIVRPNEGFGRKLQ
ncbi:protein-tyrosine phosphatase-like protein, partial [Paraphysoderma sedebokerense]